MASKCYVCGEPATGACLVCGKAFCPSHGDRLCAQCGEQDEIERRAEAYASLPSPFFFRGALAIAILAVVLEIGWDAYRSVSGPPAPAYTAPAVVGAAQTPSPDATTQPGAQPTPSPVSTAAKPTPAPPTPTPAAVRYTIQPGDTLLGIAIKMDVTLEALQAANGNLDPTRLQVGQVLAIPAKQ